MEDDQRNKKEPPNEESAVKPTKGKKVRTVKSLLKEAKRNEEKLDELRLQQLTLAQKLARKKVQFEREDRLKGNNLAVDSENDEGAGHGELGRPLDTVGAIASSGEGEFSSDEDGIGNVDAYVG